MKKETKKKEEQNLKELPLATMIIKEYQRTNKALAIISIILLVLFAIETTYIIIYWDSMLPYAGAIQENNSG